MNSLLFKKIFKCICGQIVLLCTTKENTAGKSMNILCSNCTVSSSSVSGENLQDLLIILEIRGFSSKLLLLHKTKKKNFFFPESFFDENYVKHRSSAYKFTKYLELKEKMKKKMKNNNKIQLSNLDSTTGSMAKN